MNKDKINETVDVIQTQQRIKELHGNTPHIVYVDEQMPVASNIEEAVKLLNIEQEKERKRLMQEDKENQIRRPLSRVQRRKLLREKEKLEAKLERKLK